MCIGEAPQEMQVMVTKSSYTLNMIAMEIGWPSVPEEKETVEPTQTIHKVNAMIVSWEGLSTLMRESHQTNLGRDKLTLLITC